jgi:hypothetical protein
VTNNTEFKIFGFLKLKLEVMEAENLKHLPPPSVFPALDLCPLRLEPVSVAFGAFVSVVSSPSARPSEHF